MAPPLPRLTVVVLALLALLPAAAQARTNPNKPTKPAQVVQSPFTWRGVIEGYYGIPSKPQPWTHGERTRLIKWMALHGFNAYVHAPKADPYQTTLWRDPYSAVLQRNFTKEIELAASLGVQWIPSFSPARGHVDDPKRICFSCAADMDAMLAKLKPFMDAGSRTVMVSFDDIERQLGPPDASVYGARFPGTPADYQFARATADFLNTLLTRLPPGTGLLTVLPDYAGTTDSPFLQGIREGGLNAAIGVMWTGPTIRASNFTVAEANSYAQLIGRTPIVWENWVTRDFVPTRLFLGPFNGNPDLVGSVQGFFFNPMNEPDLNMLPLATAGTWMTDPEGYDQRTAWRDAIKELSKGRQPLLGQLRAFAETSYSSGLLTKEAPTSTKLQNAYLAALDIGARWTDARDALEAEFKLVFDAANGLKALPDKRISREATPFLATARQSARTALQGVDLLAAERPALRLGPTKDGFAGVALAPDLQQADALRAKFGANLDAFRARLTGVSPLYVYGCPIKVRGCGARQYNRLDDFFTKVQTLDATWLPAADQAASGLRLTLGGKRVKRKGDGSFTLDAKACGMRLLAVDGAGGETSLPLPACPKKPPKPDKPAKG
ncbi:MAG TPA: beta-N-acetylglucosaminidase domain-containing protein [Solirubrobacteraceae bacterium]|nr:beta-N-acetylglucosaminidase domain-containing protein [Solirubrobacteraceae bacterium]